MLIKFREGARARMWMSTFEVNATASINILFKGKFHRFKTNGDLEALRLRVRDTFHLFDAFALTYVQQTGGVLILLDTDVKLAEAMREYEKIGCCIHVIIKLDKPLSVISITCHETSTSRVSAALYAEVDVKKYLQDANRLLRQKSIYHPLNFLDQVRKAEMNTLQKKLDADDGDEVIFDVDNLLEWHADFCEHIMGKAQVFEAKKYAEKFFHAEDPKVLHQRALPFPAGVTHRIVLKSSTWARGNPINSDIKKHARGRLIFSRYKDESDSHREEVKDVM
jgi:hypothetical protein